MLLGCMWVPSNLGDVAWWSNCSTDIMREREVSILHQVHIWHWLRMHTYPQRSEVQSKQMLYIVSIGTSITGLKKIVKVLCAHNSTHYSVYVCIFSQQGLQYKAHLLYLLMANLLNYVIVNALHCKYYSYAASFACIQVILCVYV